MSDEGIGMGEKLTLSATQLVLLCDSAICRFWNMYVDMKEREEQGEIFNSSLDTLEAARDEVVEFFKNHKKEKSND